jgi:hypothetical protein
MRSTRRNPPTERTGNTSRTSSRGQKKSSGGLISSRRRGEPEMDEQSHSEIREQKLPRRRRS